MFHSITLRIIAVALLALALSGAATLPGDDQAAALVAQNYGRNAWCYCG